MVKKNRHRVGRKKRERILRAQQCEAAKFVESARQIVRVEPQSREPPAPEILLVDGRRHGPLLKRKRSSF